MRTFYQEISTCKGTVFHIRPTRQTLPRQLCDPQSLPPPGWCPLCGMEIYDAANAYCDTCLQYGDGDNEELKIEN